MQEFSAISVSSYEAGSLADRLTEQSRDGWSVVAIVPTGSSVTAYLCREGEGTVGSTHAAEEPTFVASEPAPQAAVEPTPEPTPEPEAAAMPIVPPISEPEPEPAPEPAVAEIIPSAGGDPAAATDTAAAGASEASSGTAGAAPAGWYADPSGRFELRYWDGGQWTEHVSRAGQQYTDPPVA